MSELQGFVLLILVWFTWYSLGRQIDKLWEKLDRITKKLDEKDQP
jgi:hypothetical protein